MKREELDVNKLVYSTDIDTILVDCEGTEVWPQDNNGCEYYYKSQADKVMDAMEARIKELEEENKHLDDYIDAYQKSEALTIEKMDKKDERIKELEVVISKMETTAPKWISVKDRLPKEEKPYLIYVKGHQGVGDEQMVVYWDESRRDFCVGEEGWPIDDEYSEVTHWMPLPPPPTTEDSSAIEKEK